MIPKEVPEELKPYIKSIPEEILNMLSHGIGALFFLVGVPFLIQKSVANFWLLLGVIIFGISLLMVYFSSTAYHSVYKLFLKKRLRVFDHISIYFLIAGSFTPFVLAHLQTSLGWSILGIIWLMVLIGGVFKYFFTHRFNVISTLAYVGMGCMALFIITPLSRNISPESLQWLSAGGISYIIGVPFYLWKKLPFNHFIWHLFVLGGSVSHFMAVWYL
ncbi:PAQR family membrane homeostasis protein TrhA [Jiulongibacter sp. NS-SX5]|uniref:PAQR family membrane homeostasis protein TrhA n=1 Tax=Jiulongibacter sp. NS-SX5 TaxID=3463854 RepID=UPI004058D4D9